MMYMKYVFGQNEKGLKCLHLKFRICVIIIFCALSFCNGYAQFISAMTFNIRFDNKKDGINSWALRKKSVADIIAKHSPDIVGTQEGLYHQIEYLDSMMVDYQYFGNGRDDGYQKGEFCAVFYHTKKWQLLESQTYWLSPSGEVGLAGWDAALPRIFTFGVLMSLENQDTIFVINTHYDHMGKEARENSSRLILDFVKQKQSLDNTWIVMGDLNAEPHERPVTLFLEEMESGCDGVHENQSGTFNGFDSGKNAGRRIDHIFVKKGTVESCEMLYDKRSEHEFISDHFPVLMTIRLR